MSKDFEPAPLEIECVDVWHPETCSREAMLAYKQLEAEGALNIIRIEVSQYTGRVTVRYMAGVPHEWIREDLGKRKAWLRAGGEQLRMEDAHERPD